MLIPGRAMAYCIKINLGAHGRQLYLISRAAGKATMDRVSPPISPTHCLVYSNMFCLAG